MIISWDAVNWEPSVLLSLAMIFPMIGSFVLYFENTKRPTAVRVLLGQLGVCLSVILLILGIQIILAIGPWEEMKQGIYESTEYTDVTHQTSHGSIHTYRKTIVHFSDGQTITLGGEYSIAFPKGTRIKILTKNDFYKIEKAE